MPPLYLTSNYGPLKLDTRWSHQTAILSRGLKLWWIERLAANFVRKTRRSIFTWLKRSITSFSVYSFGKFVMYSLQFLISTEGGLARLTLNFLGPIKNPFFASIAASASSSRRNLTNPKPKLFFVNLSFTTLATTMSPCSENNVCSKQLWDDHHVFIVICESICKMH